MREIEVVNTDTTERSGFGYYSKHILQTLVCWSDEMVGFVAFGDLSLLSPTMMNARS
ncbi:hypothetical protein ccbrp13_20140 [Ktedonobacteria bacterium brp13]|nr:hypothetical protein ccbrp13_20140 [Ktedonobacteria bacterium brp13]